MILKTKIISTNIAQWFYQSKDGLGDICASIYNNNGNATYRVKYNTAWFIIKELSPPPTHWDRLPSYRSSRLRMTVRQQRFAGERLSPPERLRKDRTMRSF
jgi:hypothetical protein